MKFYLNQVNSFKVKEIRLGRHEQVLYVCLCEISLRCASLLLVGTSHRNIPQLLGGCRYVINVTVSQWRMLQIVCFVPETSVSCSFLKSVKPSGYYMYRQFNIQQFCVLATHCIYVFCVDLRTNSDYFPLQH
jgi:hypothetical protein